MKPPTPTELVGALNTLDVPLRFLRHCEVEAQWTQRLERRAT
jgi:hypothetical protein